MVEFIPGPSGTLEARLWLPSEVGGVETPLAACVVCHPHPSHGGTMNNSVVFRTARGLQAAGVATLRFNFRGVGRSAGVHDGAGAEEEDLRAALDFMQERYPGLPLWAAGFSFGSRQVVGLLPREPRIERIVLVALPVLAYPCEVAAQVDRPGLLVMAELDTFGTLSSALERFPNLGQLETKEVSGADHFFVGKLEELQEHVRAYAAQALGQ